MKEANPIFYSFRIASKSMPRKSGQDLVQSGYAPLQRIFTMDELDLLMGARSELDPAEALMTGLLPSLQRYVQGISPAAVAGAAHVLHKVEQLNSAHAAFVTSVVEMALCSCCHSDVEAFFSAAGLAPADPVGSGRRAAGPRPPPTHDDLPVAPPGGRLGTTSCALVACRQTTGESL